MVINPYDVFFAVLAICLLGWLWSIEKRMRFYVPRVGAAYDFWLRNERYFYEKFGEKGDLEKVVNDHFGSRWKWLRYEHVLCTILIVAWGLGFMMASPHLSSLFIKISYV